MGTNVFGTIRLNPQPMPENGEVGRVVVIDPSQRAITVWPRSLRGTGFCIDYTWFVTTTQAEDPLFDDNQAAPHLLIVNALSYRTFGQSCNADNTARLIGELQCCYPDWYYDRIYAIGEPDHKASFDALNVPLLRMTEFKPQLKDILEKALSRPGGTT